MKLRYKQILAFVVIILFSSIPLSFYILHEQEEIKVNVLKHRSSTECRILSRSIYNIIMMNGGSIPECKLDSRELVKILSVLSDDGLVYAEALLVSAKKKYNGIVLAYWVRDDLKKDSVQHPQKYSNSEVLDFRNNTYRERFIPGIGEVCYEFTSSDSPRGIPQICLTRLVFSKKDVLLPLVKLRNKAYIGIVFAIFLVTLLGIIFGKIITIPVEKLIHGVEHISEGEFEYRIETGTRDEFAKLATTFNHLARIIKLEITELKNANVELQRLDKLKDEFLASVSHELRTPLFGIIGLTESLLESSDCNGKDNALQDLSLIAVSAKRLSHLINNILDISKLKHGDILIRRTPVDMYSIVQLVISVLMPLVDDKKISLKNELLPGRVIVVGDENRLQQIMFNVIGNAVKFTEKGSVSARSSAVYEEDNSVVIEIADTGIGVPEEKFDFIFESFAQADGSNERMYSGTGLGLAITRKLVELHGGEIWCEKNEPCGMVFMIKLRGSSAYPSEIIETETASHIPYIYSEDQLLAPAAGQGLTADRMNAGEISHRILVVDDEPVVRRLVQKILESSNYSVDTAESGEQALEYLRSESIPDLIVLDIMLPKISGYDICRTIRESYTLYEMPVLMLTAKNKPGDVLDGFEAGANDYITKPVERKELLARVNSLISFRDSARLSGELKVINHDLELAHEIQQTVLLKEIPEIENIEISVRYLPMIKLGGDFYSVYKYDEDRIGFLMADVSGHGISAAFICAMLKVVYSFFIEQEDNPASLFQKINSNMYQYLNAQFITACFAIVDKKHGRIFHTNAGHWPMLIWRSEDKIVEQVITRGLPFGWFEKGVYSVTEVEVKNGDRLIFYTDGIIEIRDIAGKMFTLENFLFSIEKYHSLNSEEFIDSILADIRNWSKGNEKEGYDDDVTIMVVDIK